MSDQIPRSSRALTDDLTPGYECPTSAIFPTGSQGSARVATTTRPAKRSSTHLGRQSRGHPITTGVATCTCPGSGREVTP
jgi:hypothetical protein